MSEVVQEVGGTRDQHFSEMVKAPTWRARGHRRDDRHAGNAIATLPYIWGGGHASVPLPRLA